MTNARPFLISTFQDLFQWHQEHLNARCFAPCCRALNIWESRRTPNPNSFQVLGFTPTLGQVRVATSKLPGCFCQGNKAKHPKWSQVPLPFEKWIIVVQAKRTLCARKKDARHTFERMSLVGHGGAKRTTTFLKKSYYWPNLKDDAEEYMKICLTCQQNRTLNKKKTGLLQPWQFPKGRGKCVNGFYG